MSSPGQALVSVALMSEILTRGQAFSIPSGFTSLERIQAKNGYTWEQNTHQHRTKRVLWNYYGENNQWEEDDDSWNDEMNFHSSHDTEQHGKKRAILGGAAAIGTMMAINTAVGMNAGAEPVDAETHQAPFVEEQVSSYSSVVNAQQDVTLPYLEEKIQAAEEALQKSAPVSYESSTDYASEAYGEAFPTKFPNNPLASSVVANAETAANPATGSTSVNTAISAPSFVRYTQEKMPVWIETGQKVYDAAAPKVVAGGQKLWSEVDKKVTPKIIEKEHEILGDANSAVLDQTLSNVAYAGKMVAGMVGKAISLGIQGGVQVAKATPEVIKAGKQVYDTMDQKIIPEVVDTSRKIKTIADKTVPEVMDASKHAYDTIMPELMGAERQVASTVRAGMDMAMPTVMEVEKKVMPVLSSLEHDILGDEGAYQFEKTVADAAKQGQNTIKAVGDTIPQVVASGQKTVDGVAYTGRTVARAVPLIIESGKQAYDSVDRSVSQAIATTQDIASDIDRAAGKTAYAIEDNLFDATEAIDKAIPALLETGRVVATTGAEIAKTVETGGKAIIEDVSGFVEDVTVDSKIDSASKRFAATNPVYKDYTASVNDPNNLGKL